MTDILFELPAHARAAVEDASNEGHPPWSFINRARFVEGASIRKSNGAQAGSFYGLAANSLATVPPNARFLAVSGRARDFQNLPDFPELEVVQVYDRVTENEIRVLAQIRSLHMLSLYNIRAQNVDPLAALRNLAHLHCDGAPTLTRLHFLQELRGLRTLWLEHFRGLKELSEIGALTQLWGLVLAGSMWTAMRVRSLQPLSALVRLRQLHLINVRVDDGSLVPLTRLTNLRQLWVPNWFRVAEFAALAAFLPTTDGPFHSPWFVEPKPLEEPHYSACKRCGRHSLGMSLGKPVKHLCPECDAAKIAKLIRHWATLVAGAGPS
ncbi:MAG: hypothetical protein HY700_20265 [Gemmatimonadetes bacterium]|nr:hypothetical protein [Gemmatimonadota bacterium]